MNCKKCNQEIQAESKFCNFCGASVEDEPVQEETVKETNEETSDNKSNNKKMKIIKWSSIGAGAVIIITLAIVFFAVILPDIQYENEKSESFAYADTLLEQGKFSEAFDIYHKYSLNYDMMAEIIENNMKALLDKGEYIKAYELMSVTDSTYEIACDTYFGSGSSKLLRVLEQKYGDFNVLETEYSAVYSAIQEMLNYDVDISRNESYVDFVLFYSSLVPITYEDVSTIKLIFDSLKLEKFDLEQELQYVYSLWKYKAIRSLALSDDLIKQFLIGNWTTEKYFPSIKFTENNDGKVSVSIQGIPTPNISAKYYDIQDLVYVYTNGNDKLCDVLKFTIDESDPDKMTVFAFENSQAYELYRIYR